MLVFNLCYMFIHMFVFAACLGQVTFAKEVLNLNGTLLVK